MQYTKSQLIKLSEFTGIPRADLALALTLGPNDITLHSDDFTTARGQLDRYTHNIIALPNEDVTYELMHRMAGSPVITIYQDGTTDEWIKPNDTYTDEGYLYGSFGQLLCRECYSGDIEGNSDEDYICRKCGNQHMRD